MIGKTISHYRILEKLGEGGMGVVYKAQDIKLKRTVALKFLPSELTRDQEAKERFIHEAQAASALDHPNICTIHEIDETDDGQMFVCMACYEGETVKEKISRGPLKLEEAVDITIHVAEGLARAHEVGITHRDIKPANIMVTKRSEVKILDFGLAKLAGQTKLTKTGATLGTVAYMSPEQARGEEVDQRMDIWSLGVVLYEMVTGKLPFKSEYDQAVVYSILNEEPEPMRGLRSDVPMELERIVNRTLAKSPEERYQHVDEILTDLKSVKREIDSGRPSAYAEIPPAPPSRPRLFPWLVGPLTVVVLGVLLLWLIPSSRHAVLKWFSSEPVPVEKHLVVLPFTNVGEALTSQAFCDGLMETLTSKLTQLEQFHGSLWVVPASEVRERGVDSAGEARRAFGVTLAVTGSVQRLNDKVRMTLNLVDAETERQMRSLVIDDSLANVSALQDSTVIKLAGMLEVQLQPEEHRFLTAGGTTAPEAYNLYLQGRGYLQRYEKVENIDTAIGLFQRAMGEDSRYALAYAGLGEAYWRKYEASKEPQWVEHAINNGQRAVELNDFLAPVHITLGLIHKGTGRYQEAIQEFKQALKLDPVSHDAYRGLAIAYLRLNKVEQAEATLRKVIELKPDYWAGYYDLATFYLNLGRHEDAVKQLHKAVTLVPDGFYAHNDLGALYFNLGRWTDARKMWERSLEIEPNYAAYSNLGILHHIEMRYGDAARMYEKALELDNRNYRVWGNLASAYYWMPGERGRALATYQRAAQMAEEERKVNPHDPEVLSDLAEYYAMIRERTRALSHVQQALSLASDDIEVMASAGLVYELLGERDRALEWVGKALEHGYPRAQIERLPELQQLRADPRFQRLHQDSSDKFGKDTESEQ